MTSTLTPVSIIVPTLNEEAYLPRLLASLAGQDFASPIEVIVVDGGSHDDTLSSISIYNNSFQSLQTYTTDANIGKQRNCGARHAKYDLLLFLDADVTLPRHAVRRVVEQAARRERFVMAIPHRPQSISIFEAIFGAFVYFLVLLAWIFRFPVTNGDFLLTNRRNHESIGGFAEGALLGEDTDYGIRSVRGGARYVFCWKTYVVASKRRLQLMSMTEILRTWSGAFIHVVRKGPVYDREKWTYPFGHYAPPPH